MNVNMHRATAAYGNSTKMMDGVKDSGADLLGNVSGNKGSFGEMLGNALNSAIDSQYHAEETKIGAMTGKQELSDLVTSVTEADLTLNTVVAVRDRVINAYQDIMRMPM